MPYLRDLGVSHLYLSPSLQALEGSTHGYDVVDPTRISEALGGEEAFRELCGEARRQGLGRRARHRPEPHGGDGREPVLARPALAGAVLRPRLAHGLAPALLRRRRARRRADGGSRGLGDHAREGARAGARRSASTGSASTIRTGSRTRAATSSGCARRGSSTSGSEKILEPGEQLRDWPVEGTTGYEFLNEVCALFVDPAGEEPLTALYEEITGDTRGFHEIAHECKLREARVTFEEDAERLQALLPGLDVDLPAALAAFPVYRTYVQPFTGRVDDADREAVERAGLPAELARILLLEEGGHDAFVLRFQQTTPPVHAKGVEDTAFYRWNRLLALNEVGGDPARFNVSVEDFHRSNLERAERFPRHLLATMTHDAKRSADVRARLACLAGCPDEWAALVRPRLDGWRDANEAYLILQTVVGAWPLDAGRLELYLEKALREAKVHTTWIDQDHEWEAGAVAYAVSLLEDDDVRAFAERLAATAERVSLGMTLLKLTCPGVPDLYQGDELPYLALVDPDNRRPVDWEERRRALASPAPPAKLDLIRRTLALRARRPAAFAGCVRAARRGRGHGRVPPRRRGQGRGGAARRAARAGRDGRVARRVPHGVAAGGRAGLAEGGHRAAHRRAAA